MTCIHEILDVHLYSHLEEYYRGTFQNVYSCWIPVSFYNENMFCSANGIFLSKQWRSAIPTNCSVEEKWSLESLFTVK